MFRWETARDRPNQPIAGSHWSDHAYLSRRPCITQACKRQDQWSETALGLQACKIGTCDLRHQSDQPRTL